MKKIMLLVLGLIVSSAAAAEGAEPTKSINHTITLAGLQPGEGRVIRSDIFENNKFKSGYYFCAGSNSTVYTMEYFFSKSQEPFHVEHLTRFSICQDETLANCQEFATDKYQTFRTLDGYLQNDVTHSTVDLSPLKAAYQSCEPTPEMDELVKKSIHLSDRLFAHIG
ncbi:hypothetical protein ACD661_08070 [Legionella lytica]|uniref:Uncharacterized protein n=1 Tax=Legionella lytica TaxID=96232 RepID=A0ABW8D733_9GAMM